MSDVPLVVLAAGLSKRFGRLKQLEPLGPGGEALMDYNIYDAARAGFGRAVLVTRPEIREHMEHHVEEILGPSGFPVSIVEQTLETGVDGFRTPPDRAKPWGTGQAVLLASAVIGGPFAVCNADDLYGPGAFRLLHEHMVAGEAAADAALVGYKLGETLSRSGGVSRAICTLRGGRQLAGIVEVQDVRKSDGWITGREVDGEPVELEDEATVSMNLWGFTPHVLELLARQFRVFLGSWGAEPMAEFYLSTALNHQVEIDATRVTVLQAPDRWLGLTHGDEHEPARRSLEKRIAEGVYPERLAEGFSRFG